MKRDLPKDKNPEERAVSPVIGVILMVAITVILAAVIAAFVLDLGQSQGANAQAGIAFDQDGNDVTITVNSVTRADSLTIQGTGDCATSNSFGNSESLGTDAGNSKTIDVGNSSVTGSEDIACDASSGDAIQIIGEYNGNSNVVQTYEI